MGFPGGAVAKNPPAMQEMQETRVRSLGPEDPLEKGMVTHSIFLPGEFHRQRNLVGYSPWGYKELGMIKRLTLFTFHRIGKSIQRECKMV